MLSARLSKKLEGIEKAAKQGAQVQLQDWRFKMYSEVESAVH